MLHTTILEANLNQEIIWVTLINRGYVEYTINFLKSMKKSQTNFQLVIFCIDPDIPDIIKWYDTNDSLISLYICIDATLFMPRACSSELEIFYAEKYKNIVFSKLDTILYAMKTTVDFGVKNIGYIDTDIVILSDPSIIILEKMKQYENIQIFCQCDENISTSTCTSTHQCPIICSGCIVFRNIPDLYPCFVYSEDDILKYNGDQTFLVEKIHHYHISYMTIDRKLFLNGAYYKYHSDHPPSASIIHFNYLIGNDKKKMMQAKGMWLLETSNVCYRLCDWQTQYKEQSNLIVQASDMNGSDSWQIFPIGMSWQYGLNYTKGKSIQIGKHDQLVLCALPNLHSDNQRRPCGMNRISIVNQLKQNGIINISLDHTEYFDVLPSYKFVISPEGNGIDCHRHYEALIAGCIPIMERNPLTEQKYRGCPVLWTIDYSEINTEYLTEKYQEMIQQEYNFSALFLSYYDAYTQKMIKMNGNAWMQRLTNNIWYDN